MTLWVYLFTVYVCIFDASLPISPKDAQIILVCANVFIWNNTKYIKK